MGKQGYKSLEQYTQNNRLTTRLPIGQRHLGAGDHAQANASQVVHKILGNAEQLQNLVANLAS